MKTKNYYVVHEVTVTLSGEMEKETPENNSRIAQEIVRHLNQSGRTKEEYVRIDGEYIMSIHDEKGVSIW